MNVSLPTEPELSQRALERCEDALVRLIAEHERLTLAYVSERVRRGLPSFCQDRELATVRRFRLLGPCGIDMAVALLRRARAAIGAARMVDAPPSVGAPARQRSVDAIAA